MWQGLALRLGKTEQVLRKLLNPESHQMMTMKQPERKQTSLTCNYWLSSCDLTFDETPWKAFCVPFFKATVAGFRGFQVMEINSNDCFPVTFIAVSLRNPHVFASIAQIVKQA